MVRCAACPVVERGRLCTAYGVMDIALLAPPVSSIHEEYNRFQNRKEPPRNFSPGGSFITLMKEYKYYSMHLPTAPEPTVRPPSRIAKRRPGSIATGLINSTVISTLSPGTTISMFAGKSTTPVTSVVRK
jgi:hypothetical protein